MANDSNIHDLVRDVLAMVPGLSPDAEEHEVMHRDRRSNDVAEVQLRDERVLVVKRAREAWMGERFRVSRKAARLIREHTSLLAPDYLELDGLGPRVLVYWWMPCPTLAEVWPQDMAARAEALRSCGALMRQLHAIRLGGFGMLGREGARSAAESLRRDLQDRLLPAVDAAWTAAATHARALLHAVDTIPFSPSATVVHNDVFDQNILCAREGEPRGIGLIDFEDALAGPAEADLAKTELLHGPLFDSALETGWFEHVLAGYGTPPQASARAWFRAYHLLNMGYYATLRGWGEHAADLAQVIGAEVAWLASPEPHEAVVRRSGYKK